MTTTSTPAYTLTALAPITLGSRTFTAERQVDTATGETMTWLYGARGAAYWLAPAGAATGRYVVTSWATGAPLRDRCGRPVRVTMLGEVIEAAGAVA